MAMNIQPGPYPQQSHQQQPQWAPQQQGAGTGMDQDPMSSTSAIGQNAFPGSGSGSGSTSPGFPTSRSGSGGGMSALSALMRGGSNGNGNAGGSGSPPTAVHSPTTPTGGIAMAMTQQQQQQQYEQQIQQHEPYLNQNQQAQQQGGDNSQNSNTNANANVNVNVNPNGYHYGAHAYQPGSFPNQPHNSPTFPSNLSPYAQPFVLPSTGGYSYSQTGIPMSLTGMGSLLNTHHQFPGSGSIGMGMGMGMSISPQYGAHWAHSGLGLGTTGGGMGMSFGHMGSYLGASSRGGQNHMNHMHSAQGGGGLGVGSIGADPNLQIGPGPAGSSVNSAMMMQHGHGGAWGVGGERSRELEKRYVRDFTCCGLKLGGLHDLLEHYEECHVHLAPDLRKQSMSIDAGANPENLIIPQNPAINAISRTGTPSTSFPSASPFSSRPQPVPPSSSTAPSMTTKQSSPTESDAPGTPGMMDIEMTMDDDDPTGVGIVGGAGSGGNMPSILPPSSAQWTAFQQAQQPPPGGFPQCVEPSKLSYAIPGVGAQSGSASQPVSKPGTPVGGLNGVNLAFNGAGTGAIGKPPRLGGSTVLTPEQKAERAARKAAKKEARRIAKENGELSSDDGRDAEGFKKYRCPVPGCNKSYRQANGLKYHVQRSINSTHGHLVNVPLLPHPHHPDTKAHEKTAPV